MGCCNRVDQIAKPLCSGSMVVFFSAAGRPVLPLSFSLGAHRSHAHDEGARNRRMVEMMAGTIGPMTATSACSKVIARASRTNCTPVLTSLSCGLISHQSAIKL